MIGSRALGAFQDGGNAVDVPVAALAGLSIAFLAFAAPSDLLANLVGSSGLPAILPAAEPPLGLKARIGIGAAGAVIVFGLAFALLRWLNSFGSAGAAAEDEPEAAEAPLRRRRRDLHPDAPVRPPLATCELGEPALDPWPEPQPRLKREPEWQRTPEPEPEPEPQPVWEPEPEPRAEPLATFEPEPAPRPGPELVSDRSDPMESAWALSRPYDPVIHVKQPSRQGWPSLEDEEPAEPAEAEEAEWTEEVEEEPSAPSPGAWGFEPEDAPAAPAAVAGDFEGEPESAPEPVRQPEWLPQAQAESEPEPEPEPIMTAPSIEPWQAKPEVAAEPVEPIAPAAPARHWPPEPEAVADPEASAASAPAQDNSIDALLARLEQGLARRRTEPAPSAPVASAPPSPAPPAAPLDPADHRLQNAIDHLQRLAARRD